MNIAAGDFTEQYFPLRAFVAREWVQGRVPLWNPYLYGGQPALADIQSGALYPPHVLEALLLGWVPPLFGREIGFPLKALEWQVIVHFSLAAVGTYLFVRYVQLKHGLRLRQARFGGLIASLAFTYSGYLTGFPVQQMTILTTSAWLPWILWGLTISLDSYATTETGTAPEGGRLFNPSQLGAIAWTGLAFAMAVLAGHPQTVLYIFYLTLAYTIFKVIYPRPKQSTRWLTRSLSYGLILWMAALLLGMAIAAAQLLPTWEFITYSLRADLSYQAVSAGLPLTELIAVLYPGFFGGSPQYVGVATLVLTALALILAWAGYKEAAGRSDSEERQAPGVLPVNAPLVFFWAGAGLASLLVAFGDNLFVYPLFYLLAPGFELVRQQERAFLIFSFSAAMLASDGAVALTSPLPRPLQQAYHRFEARLRVVAGVALAMTAFFIYGSTTAMARSDEVNLFFGVLRHHLFGLIILGGMVILLSLRRRRWLRRPWAMGILAVWLAFNLFTVNWRFNLEATPAPFTVNGTVQFLQAHLSTRPGRIVSGGLLPGGNNAASVYQLEDLTGNTPLQLAQVHRFLESIPAWRLWQLMNVRYVIDRRDIGDPGLRPVFEEGELKVFEMGDPFERAWLVPSVEVMADGSAIVQRLAAAELELRQIALASVPPALPLRPAATGTVSVSEFSPTYLEVDVTTQENQLLVLSQIYYPGWRAEIDGRPVDLLRLNLVQQGLVIPAGDHLVRLSFRPNSFIAGSLITGAAFLLSVGMLIWNRRYLK
jgi:hypothetical protein